MAGAKKSSTTLLIRAYIGVWSVITMAGLGHATLAQARDILLLAGGGFAFRSFSQYTGAILPFNNQDGGFSQDGPMLRFWQKSFAFSYTADLSPNGLTDTTIDAIGGSFTGEFGYQKNLSQGRVAFYTGLAYRRFDLSPDDPGADLNKAPVGIPLTLDASWSPYDQISVSTNLSYTILHEDYWAQFKIAYQASSTVKLGPEIVFQGGSEYRYVRFGAFVSGIKLGNLNLGANFGLRDDRRENQQSLYGDLHISFFY